MEIDISNHIFTAKIRNFPNISSVFSKKMQIKTNTQQSVFCIVQLSISFAAKYKFFKKTFPDLKKNPSKMPTKQRIIPNFAV